MKDRGAVLAVRIVSGIIGIAVAAFVIQTGGAVFCAAVLLLALTGWHEYAQAFRHKNISPAYWSGMAAAVCFLGAAYLRRADLLAAAVTVFSLCFIVLFPCRRRWFRWRASCMWVCLSHI